MRSLLGYSKDFIMALKGLIRQLRPVEGFKNLFERDKRLFMRGRE